MQMMTGTYTGDGNDNRWIEGIGFNPDLVIIKRDGNTAAVFRSSSMSGDVTLYFSTASGALPNMIQELDTDKFQVGTNAAVNSSGQSYYYIAFKDDGAYDFAVGSYTGDGNDNRSISGVGFQPNLVMVKRDGAIQGCWHPSSLAGDSTLYFHGAAAAANLIQAFEADGFQIGSGGAVNTNGGTHYYAAWKEVAGYIDVGTYTGDGNDDRSISGVGFQPDYMWVKNQSEAVSAAHLSVDNSADDCMDFLATANAANLIQDLETDGFQVGTDQQVNKNTIVYHYAAWKIRLAAAATGAGVGSGGALIF